MTKDKRTTPEFITHLEPNEIFVFGSNLAGGTGKEPQSKPLSSALSIVTA